VLFKDCAADEVCSGKYCLAKGVDCNDECINYSNDCSEDKTKIFKKTCGDYDDDDCLEYSEVSFEYCGSGEECSDGVCICYDECVNDEVSCSDDSTVRTRICRDNNNDGCKEYTGTILVTCDAGKVCDDGACVVDSSGVASLSLGFSGVSYVWQSPQHYYYHTRTFSESNGVGVTLTSGQLCFQSTGECNSAAVNYRIEAGGSLVRSGENFATPTTPDQFTLKYSGTDDNGNSINIQEVVSVSGSSWLSP